MWPISVSQIFFKDKHLWKWCVVSVNSTTQMEVIEVVHLCRIHKDSVPKFALFRIFSQVNSTNTQKSFYANIRLDIFV